MRGLILFFITSFVWYIENTPLENRGDKEEKYKGKKGKKDDDSDIPVIEECNGFMELCDMVLSQVTLAGTHNSGAGFAGPLKYHSRMGRTPASSCANRFQGKSIYDQLVLGIRYFDIHACWVDNYEPKGAWACYGKAYAGPVKAILEQIDMWMNEPYNRNEIVVLHFKGVSKHEYKTMTGANIIRQLAALWEPSDNKNTLRRLSIQPSIEAKLGDAIRHNQRIYVIMHNELVLGNRESWIIPHWTVGSTYTDMSFIESNGCYSLMKEMGESRCQREAAHTFIRYDMYLKSGLCRKHLAQYCKKFIPSGVSKCFVGTSTRRRTVNFIIVDYAGDEVVQAARTQNVENIQYFLKKTVPYPQNPTNHLCNVLTRFTKMGVPVYVGNHRFKLNLN